MTRFLDLIDLVDLVDELGVGPVRDVGLLESAAARPTTTLWGREAYPSLELKAAALLESLVRNHPLVDGNKRLGFLAVVVFLGLNGLELDAPDDDAYDMVIAVAEGRAELAATQERLGRWCVPEAR